MTDNSPMTTKLIMDTVMKQQPSLLGAGGQTLTDFLDQMAHQMAQNDCCGIPGCDHNEDLTNQILLIDAESVGLGNPCQRVEGFVLKTNDNSLKLRFKNESEGWYDQDVIEGNLGPATPEQYMEFGVEPPPVETTPNYSTGTYVASTPKGTFLLEVDRVGSDYYIHEVGDCEVEALTPQVWECLDNFSDPDGPGNYTAEPGMYYVARIGKMVEVIPYGGYSYYRFINDSELRRLSPSMVKDCTQVESDTFEVNAVMILPQDAPAKLNNTEDAPTGCCQSAPREEPCEA